MSEIDVRKMSEEEIVNYLTTTKDPYLMEICPKTNRICAAGVMNNGMSLAYVPYNMRTEDICKMAISNDPDAIQYVPEENLTTEIMELAVSLEPMTLRFLGGEKQKQIVGTIISAVKSNPEALMFVKEVYPNNYFNICMAALEVDGSVLKYVDFDRLDSDRKKLMITTAVVSYPKAITYIPDEGKYRHIFKMAVKLDGLTFGMMDPDKYKDLAHDACMNDGHALDYVHDDDLYDELSSEVAYHDPEAILSCKLTHANLLTAVGKDGLILKNIDPKYITEAIAKRAYLQNPNVRQILEEKGKAYLLDKSEE